MALPCAKGPVEKVMGMIDSYRQDVLDVGGALALNEDCGGVGPGIQATAQILISGTEHNTASLY